MEWVKKVTKLMNDWHKLTRGYNSLTARRSDYDLEEWPYPASMDIVGDLYMREIGDDE
jgi:hypothetical protein